MRITKSILILLGMLGLTGCQTTPESCDPANSNIGFFDKMSCNMSGHYQTRIDDKKQILLDEQAINAQFKEIYASIEQQKNDSTLSVKQKQAQQQQLQNELSKLTREIKSKSQSRQDIQKQIDEIDKQLKTVNNSNGSQAEKQVELTRLTSKLQSLQKALDLQ